MLRLFLVIDDFDMLSRLIRTCAIRRSFHGLDTLKKGCRDVLRHAGFLCKAQGPRDRVGFGGWTEAAYASPGV